MKVVLEIGIDDEERDALPHHEARQQHEEEEEDVDDSRPGQSW